jgi:hypothetical protein
MEFASADPSAVRSIKQRALLNAWLRTPRRSRPLPALGDFRPDGISGELADMMAYEVEGDGETARFLIAQEGSRLIAAYGVAHTGLDHRTRRYLDDVAGAERYARIVPCYRACLARKRPAYSILRMLDSDGKEVSFERLLLPFGRAEKVEYIIGSYKAVSIESGFTITNLKGISASKTRVQVVNAVIETGLSRRPTSHGTNDAIIELS